jgi:SulP family sulfate permease
VPADLLAGVTLAAVNIPIVLGYAKIAGMPVVTGLYTLLLPLAVFAVLGSSRHLVVAGDSATAAILGAALSGLAVAGSPRYVRLAGLAALLTGLLLLIARVARLGFLTNFLSRTVLVGFLTGVGISVAADQLPEMLGLTVTARQTIPKFLQTARALPHLRWADVALSAGVIVIVLRGLPHLAAPALGRHDAAVLLGTALAMSVVILAQSAVTARSCAALHEEAFSQEADLVGLGAANVAAAFSGTFVVNGSPTQTQVTDSAGGRSQLASLTAAAIVLLLLLLFTGALTQLPIAALAAVVFVIAVRLIDVTGMRRILGYSRAEFAVALLTTVAVVVMGVEDGIALAIVISIINHLRHSYRPLSSVLTKSPAGHWKAVPVTPGARTENGLVIYRFGTSLYYANAPRLVDDVSTLAGHGGPLRWLMLDFAAIGDVDYTAAGVLSRVTELLGKREVRFAVSSVLGPVRKELDRYGINAALGPGAYYETPGEALEAFKRATSTPT